MRARRLLLLPMLSLLGATAARSADVTAKPRAAALRSPQAVIAPRDLRTGYSSPVAIRNGAVYPQTVITFDRNNDSHTLNLAGDNWTIVPQGPSQYLLRPDKGRPVGTRRRGQSMMPAVLTLSNRTRYVLAFPYERSYRGRGGTRQSLGCRSGMVQTFRLGRTEVHLYDQNLDGRYTVGQDAYCANYRATGPMAFGSLSHQIATSNGVYVIEELEPDGSRITLNKSTEDTAELGVSFLNRLSQACVVLQGSNRLDVTFAATGRQVSKSQVTPANYSIGYGIVYAPRRGQVVAGIVTGECPPVVVSDQKATLELGAPFKLRFDASARRGRINVSARGIRLFGKAGEEYVDYDLRTPPTLALVQGNQQASLGRMEFG